MDPYDFSDAESNHEDFYDQENATIHEELLEEMTEEQLDQWLINNAEPEQREELAFQQMEEERPSTPSLPALFGSITITPIYNQEYVPANILSDPDIPVRIVNEMAIIARATRMCQNMQWRNDLASRDLSPTRRQNLFAQSSSILSNIYAAGYEDVEFEIPPVERVSSHVISAILMLGDSSLLDVVRPAIRRNTIAMGFAHNADGTVRFNLNALNQRNFRTLYHVSQEMRESGYDAVMSGNGHGLDGTRARAAQQLYLNALAIDDDDIPQWLLQLPSSPVSRSDDEEKARVDAREYFKLMGTTFDASDIPSSLNGRGSDLRLLTIYIEEALQLIHGDIIASFYT